MSQNVRIQQRIAADGAHSAWVSANAGSGKTRVLVERILRLMLTGTPPDKILALTFTKAAAAEMKERLFKTLGAWTGQDDEALTHTLQELTGQKNVAHLLAGARTLFATALETPGGLKVQTIHGFCQAVLERFPVEAGMPPNFEVIEASAIDDLQSRALRDVIIAAGHDRALDDALNIVMAVEGEHNFRKALGQIIQQREAFHSALNINGGMDGLISRIAQAMDIAPDIDGVDLTREFVAKTDFEKLKQLASLYQSLTGKRMADQLAALSAFLNEPEACLDDYWSVVAKKDGDPKSAAFLLSKAAIDAQPHWLEFLADEYERHAALRSKLNAIATVQRTRALLVLAQAMLGRYAAMKQMMGKFDFEDLITHTRRLLEAGEGVAWVMYKLDGGIDHILVDEAQDTSPSQWRIIELLATEFFSGQGARADVIRTVFAVGDDKQSIYSFQGADPKGFARMRNHFQAQATQADHSFESVLLPTSFRSTPPVLGFVDAVFADPQLQASLTASNDAVQHIAYRQGHAGHIELWPAVEPPQQPEPEPWDTPLDVLPAAAPQVILANRIATTIKSWLQSGEQLKSKNRPIRPGDIMILVRKRGSFMATMVKALKEQGVPVAGTDRMVLTDQMAVKDMLYAAQSALLPTDDLCLATCLKSPLIGFDEDQLYDLAANRAPETRLWAELQRRRTDNPAFGAAADCLDQWIHLATAVRPFEFFAHLLGPQGGRRKLVARFGAQANDPLDELLNAALHFEETELATLHGFLHFLQAQEGDLKRDLMRADNEVRVMTTHGAKGLEGAIVFMPDTFSPPTGQNMPDILNLADTEDAFVPAWRGSRDTDPIAVQAARQDWLDEQMKEYRRLLYVGLTRAEDRLYLCGFKTPRAKLENSWYELVEQATQEHGEVIEHSFTGEDEPVAVWRWSTDQTAPIEPVPHAAAQPLAAPLPDWTDYAAPVEPQPTRPLSPSRTLVEDVPAPSPRSTDEGAQAAMKRGTLIHKALELLPDLPHANREAACRRYFALPGFGLNAEQIELLTNEVMGLLTNRDFAALFGPNGQAEVPIAGAVTAISATTIISGQIDRLCVTEDEVLIVDYKTNRHVPGAIGAVPASYVAQLALYRAALKPLYANKKIRAGLLWTHAPSFMVLPEDLLDQAEADLRQRAQSGS